MPRLYSLRMECLEDRVTPTTYGIPWPDPEHLTLSFVPDRTQVVGSLRSSLFQTLDAQEPRVEWQQAILKAFQTWAVNANINIGVSADGGEPLGTPGPPQHDPRFGDIRVVAVPLAPGVVAFSEPFDYSAGRWSGVVELNTQYFYAGSPYDIYSVVLHEAGHVFGLPDNETDTASVMFEQFLDVRTGIAPEDVAAIQALYGVRTPDAFEPNNTFATAARLSPGSSSSQAITADITNPGETDFYEFKPNPNVGTFTVTVQTAGISLLDAQVTVFDDKFNALPSDDPLNTGPLTVYIDRANHPSRTYYIEVNGVTSDAFGIGSYQLQVTTDLPKHDKPPDLGPQNVITGTLTLPNATNLQGKNVRTDSTFTYGDEVSLDGTNTTFFRFQTPNPHSSTGDVMTVTAWAEQPGAPAPLVTLYDADGTPVAAPVLINENGTYTLQLDDTPENTGYYLGVSSAVAGDYFMGIGFGEVADQRTTFVDHQVLNTTNPYSFGTLHVLQSQLFHLVATLDGGTAGQVGQITVLNGNGATVLVLPLPAGQTETGTLVLNPDQYTVELKAVPGAVPLIYTLQGMAVSDPIGPRAVDTTLAPGGSDVTFWWQMGYSAYLSLTTALKPIHNSAVTNSSSENGNPQAPAFSHRSLSTVESGGEGETATSTGPPPPTSSVPSAAVPGGGLPTPGSVATGAATTIAVNTTNPSAVPSSSDALSGSATAPSASTPSAPGVIGGSGTISSAAGSGPVSSGVALNLAVRTIGVGSISPTPNQADGTSRNSTTSTAPVGLTDLIVSAPSSGENRGGNVAPSGLDIRWRTAPGDWTAATVPAPGSGGMDGPIEQPRRRDSQAGAMAERLTIEKQSQEAAGEAEPTEPRSTGPISEAPLIDPPPVAETVARQSTATENPPGGDARDWGWLWWPAVTLLVAGSAYPLVRSYFKRRNQAARLSGDVRIHNHGTGPDRERWGG